MQRIQCYSVVTPTDACQLLVQIGALHLSSPTIPSLIVMSDIVHLLETEWDNTTDQSKSLSSFYWYISLYMFYRIQPCPELEISKQSRLVDYRKSIFCAYISMH